MSYIRNWYGFALKDGIRTTTGTPNKTTGWHSIAGDVKVFASKAERDAWADGYKQHACTKVALRGFCKGMSLVDYDAMLEEMRVPYQWADWREDHGSVYKLSEPDEFGNTSYVYAGDLRGRSLATFIEDQAMMEMYNHD